MWRDESFRESEFAVLEFRLIYQGILKSNGNGKDKQAIRRYLHRQLVEVWKAKSPLKERLTDGYSDGDMVRPPGSRAEDMMRTSGSKRYLPIVLEELHLTCAIDVLLLSHSPTGLVKSGDLDNRMKTLLDALCVPTPDNQNSPAIGDENPLYCVLEDDKLISELRVVGDFLFAPPDQVVQSPRINVLSNEPSLNEAHVYAVINIAIKKTRAMYGNVDF
jgi:hypothetical protein